MEEEDKSTSVSSVFTCILSDDCGEAEKESKAVTASKITEVLQSGMAIEINNAIVRGPINLISTDGELREEKNKHLASYVYELESQT